MATATSSTTRRSARAWVRGLHELTDHELPAAGGKAAGLAGLMRAGLPVPDGFVVLAGAYRRFVDAHELQAPIDRTLAALHAGAADEVAYAATALAERFTDQPVPDEVAAEIRAAYAHLGRAPVAVRSSSVEEDLPGTSFAGQYETFLHIRDEEELLRAVVRCWASAWSVRVLAYRARQGLSGDVDHAVVVQRQVDGARAGVLFTADPLNGRRDRVRISGAWGLGEAVVDGHVTPDEWLIEASSRRVLERRIADKAVWTVTTDQGTRTVAAPKDRRGQASLTDDEVAELAALGLRAQAAFGCPQDLEWVADDNRLLLVQSRPITTLFPLPRPEPHPDDGLRIYVSFNRVAQGFVEPLTPMGLETWRLMLSGIAMLARGTRRAPLYPKAHRVAAGRLYLDFTDFLSRPRIARAMTQSLAQKDPLAAQAVRHLTEREAAVLRRHRRRAAPPWRLLALLPDLLGRFLYGMLRPEAAAARIQRLADGEVERLGGEAARLTGVEERLTWLEAERVTPMAVVLRQLAYGAIALPAAQAAEARLRPHVGAADAFAAVHHSLPSNPTTGMGLDVLETAKQVRDDGAHPSADHPAVADFLARYGHRTVREIDTGIPRWREDPDRVLGWIAEAAADRQLDERLARERQAITEADERARELVAGVPGRLRRRRIAWHVRRARRLAGLRERPKFDEARFIEIFRDVLLAAGAELVADDRLDEADDVMFVSFADIRARGDLRVIAAANRRSHQQELHRTSIPRLMTSTGEAIYALAGPDDEGLTGVAASPGVVEGRVRVVTQPRAGALGAGEILVTHSTDPAWTPLMLRAGGIIMETGGPYMHGAIVAREHGIPAVAGLEGITERLHDGDHVRVDGEAGTVTVL